jgi:hypothetical protein
LFHYDTFAECVASHPAICFARPVDIQDHTMFSPVIWSLEWMRGTIRDPMQHLEQRPQRYCPCCRFTGRFVSAKRRGQREMRCPNCRSRPRDRQLALIFDGMKLDFRGKAILHFAPEWPLFLRLRKESGYIGADIQRRRNANAVLDITDIALPDTSVDVLICNHVLEHVTEDRKALRECRRVMKPGGTAFLSVPVQPDQQETWEPPSSMSPAEVERICGWDHKRIYGMDFADRISEAGFKVEASMAPEAQRERCRLQKDDVIFVATA